MKLRSGDEGGGRLARPKGNPRPYYGEGPQEPDTRA